MHKLSAGSSPLARGTLHNTVESGPAPRFIPARAGNTARSGSGRGTTSVHPRSRGEHARAAMRRLTRSGSSPLARGTRALGQPIEASRRFIPARAGNTGPPRCPCTGATVHPRSRGEHATEHRRPAPAAGSSPLARGTRRPSGREGVGVRFIPARAGNTRAEPARIYRAPVHPRSRGEHSRRRQDASGMTGSSPLARGTRDKPDRRRTTGRFIPARAGNTRYRRSPPPNKTVHPRSRGEHCGPGSGDQCAFGSSPLARGTPTEARRREYLRRFIPARAGNTPPPRRGARPTPVHPRSRGEHAGRWIILQTVYGSSPLARGTRRWAGAVRAEHRFIPARAGNTAPR